MWFKQLQVYQLDRQIKFAHDDVIKQLEPFSFIPCSPAMPQSMGWVSPIDEDNMPLVRSINGCIMLCLHIEEKILPAAVLRHELSETIKEVEAAQERKLSQKEKSSLKDEIFMTLLPRAFSRFTKVYAYIDTTNHRLLLGVDNKKKSEMFLSMFRKIYSGEIKAIEFNKLSSVMTYWLQQQNYPMSFAIEKSCVLQDPNHESRIIRCKDQDLTFSGIKSFIKDGYEAIQLALTWNDCLHFNLNQQFTFNAIGFADEIKEQLNEVKAETKLQHFDGDFLIMIDTFRKLLDELTALFGKATHASENIIPLAGNA